MSNIEDVFASLGNEVALSRYIDIVHKLQAIELYLLAVNCNYPTSWMVSQVSQLSQVSQVHQLHQLSQLSQLSQVSQLSQLSQLNQLSQVSQLSQLSQVGQVRSSGQVSNHSFYIQVTQNQNMII